MNYPLPPAPAPNEPLRASWGVQLIRWCRANTLLPTPGMVLSRTAGGMSYRPEPPPARGAAAAAVAKPDFTLYDASDGDTLSVGVTFGNVTPVGNAGLASGVNPWPNNFSAADTDGDGDPATPWTCEFTVAASSGAGLLYLVVIVTADPDTNAATVTSISIDNGATLPSSDATTGYFTLGTYYVTDTLVGALNPLGIGSQSYDYCGTNHYFDVA